MVDYFNGDELAAGVWIDKYALKNDEGQLMERTPDEMHHRLAREFARIEKKYANPMSEELIYSLFEHFKYLDKRWSLPECKSACYGQYGALCCCTITVFFHNFSASTHTCYRIGGTGKSYINISDVGMLQFGTDIPNVVCALNSSGRSKSGKGYR